MDLAPIAREIATILLGEPNRELSSANELRFGTKGSMSVDLKKATYYDWEMGDGGGILQLITKVTGRTDIPAWLRENGLGEYATGGSEPRREEAGGGRRSQDGGLQRVFPYRDEAGNLLFEVVRTDYQDSRPKRIRQRRTDENGKWVWKLEKETRRVLWKLPELLSAPPDEVFWVVEGELKVECLEGFGLYATCNPGGAGKWREEYSLLFRGRDVVILPDNDKPGRRHAEQVASSIDLAGSKSVKVLNLPGLGEKEDVVDWRDKYGGTPDLLLELAASAPVWDRLAAAGIDPGGGGGDDGGDDSVPPNSETEMALAMASRHRDDLRYVSAWGKFYRWVGTHWQVDTRLESFHLANLICVEFANRVTAPNMARAIASARTRAAVLSLARENPRIAATTEQWDADPWLLCTPDGTIDLRTGEMRESRPEDYSTRITAVSPGGECPTWMAFLDTVTSGDREFILYLQRMCGYLLTGMTVEQALFFLYGLGANGKSKFVEAVSGIMGDYHTVAQIETFMDQKGERHPTDLAGLMGARLVTAVETEENRTWAEAKIKALTGGDKIAARFMRQDFFEYYPQFKLVIFGNHRPHLKTVDAAMRRRMNLVPFEFTIPEADRDPNFGDRLRAEWPGILRWMIEGCMMWQRDRLRPPQRVLSATEEYLIGENTLQAWMEDCCTTDPNKYTPVAWLFNSWKKWAEAGGEFVGNQRRFVNRLESEGFTTGRKRVGDKIPRVVTGISLNRPADETEQGDPDGTGQLPY